jgi:spore germination cell wall hydrolase CwlJ-like protein
MKETLTDIGNTLVDVAITIILTILVLHGALCLFASTAMADEVLTKDERVVALTILGEARGEGKLGMYAVACVIQQRACERKLTPAQVCLQPWQFSIWNAGKGKVKKERELYYLWKSPSMSYARELARYVCKGHGLARDTTGYANHYCTLKTNNKWTRKSKPVKIIGNHKFFKL